MNGGMMEKIAMATMKMVHIVYIIKHNIHTWSSSSHAKTSDQTAKDEVDMEYCNLPLKPCYGFGQTGHVSSYILR